MSWPTLRQKRTIEAERRVNWEQWSKRCPTVPPEKVRIERVAVTTLIIYNRIVHPVESVGICSWRIPQTFRWYHSIVSALSHGLAPHSSPQRMKPLCAGHASVILSGTIIMCVYVCVRISLVDLLSDMQKILRRPGRGCLEAVVEHRDVFKPEVGSG